MQISEGAAVVFKCLVEDCTNLTLRKEQKASISVPAIFTQLRYFGFPLVVSRAFLLQMFFRSQHFLLYSVKSYQHDVLY